MIFKLEEIAALIELIEQEGVQDPRLESAYRQLVETREGLIAAEVRRLG